MKRVDAKFVRAEITNYAPRENKVEIRIVVDDGKLRTFSKQLSIKEPSSQAEHLLLAVRKGLKTEHESSMDVDSNDPLSGNVHVKWLQDEDRIQEKLARFLSEVKERMRTAMRQQASYYAVRQKLLGLNCKL